MLHHGYSEHQITALNRIENAPLSPSLTGPAVAIGRIWVSSIQMQLSTQWQLGKQHKLSHNIRKNKISNSTAGGSVRK